MSGGILSCLDGSLQTGLHSPESARSATFSIWGLLLLDAGTIDLLLLFPPNICGPLGVEQVHKTANTPPWKTCQPDGYKKATRLTNFRPGNGSLATFKLFTNSLSKLLSSPFSNLALWIYRIRFQRNICSVHAAVHLTQRMVAQPFRVKHLSFAFLL